MSTTPPELVKIDNTLIHKGIEETLSVKGVKSSPQQANVSEVGFTYDVQQGGFSGFTNISINSAPTIPGGSTSGVNVPIIGSQAYTSSAGNSVPSSGILDQQHARILACFFALTVAGATLAGKAGRIQWYLTSLNPTINSHIASVDITFGGAASDVFAVLPACFWNGFVPAGFILQVNISVNDGTFFPAGCVAVLRCAGLKKSISAWVPY